VIPPRSVTIVGASLAGLRAAETLRREGYDGSITMIGDEAHPPYDRPPLSKQVLSGEWPPERSVLTSAEALADAGIELLTSKRAIGFDLPTRKLEFGDGDTVVVDGLIVATGARCRRLPATDHLAGVHVLRGLNDVEALRSDLDAGPSRVVVVGAGFIGAEVAATIRTAGFEVTLIEAEATPLARVLGSEIGEVCGEIHRDHGVDLRTGVGVVSVNGSHRVESVGLSDGSRVAADIVVVGIGVVPNTEWLRDSGLTIDNGVVCDQTCLAAPGVVAAGDVARWPNPRFDEVMRVEHWDNAVEQGAHAARRLLVDDSAAVAFAPVPWFWSDQYDRKIQMAGRGRPGDEMHLATGSFAERRFAVLYGRAGRLVGVVGFNRPRHVMRYKSMIEDGVSFEDAVSANV